MKRLITLVAIGLLATALTACGGSSTPDETPTEQPVEETDEATGETTDAQNDTADTTGDETNDDTDDSAMPATADPNAPANVSAPPAEAEVTDSGLAYVILEEGTGDTTPTTTSVVRVHYTGWTTDGVKFDSSVDRGQPAEFPLDKVIPGWTEGVSLMKEGEKRRLWIPVELAYNNRPDRPQGMLVFDVELLAIVK